MGTLDYTVEQSNKGGKNRWRECALPTCSLSFSSSLLSCVCRCDTAHGTGKAHSATGPLWREQQSPSIVLPTQSPAGPG